MEVTIRVADGKVLPISWIGIPMNFKTPYILPDHLKESAALPRNRAERLLWIKRKVEEGYYDRVRVLNAVADAFLEPTEARRAGDRSWRGEAE